MRFIEANESRIRVETQIIQGEEFIVWRWLQVYKPINAKTNESLHEKTSNLGFGPGPTQTGLNSRRYYCNDNTILSQTYNVTSVNFYCYTQEQYQIKFSSAKLDCRTIDTSHKILFVTFCVMRL